MKHKKHKQKPKFSDKSQITEAGMEMQRQNVLQQKPILHDLPLIPENLAPMDKSPEQQQLEHARQQEYLANWSQQQASTQEKLQLDQIEKQKKAIDWDGCTQLGGPPRPWVSERVLDGLIVISFGGFFTLLGIVLGRISP